MGKVGELMGKAKGTVTDVKEHWNEPAQGKYISYKEFASYSVGGMGVNTLNTLFFYLCAADRQLYPVGQCV